MNKSTLTVHGHGTISIWFVINSIDSSLSWGFSVAQFLWETSKADFKDQVVFGAKFFPHSFIFLEKSSIVKMLHKLKDGDSRPIKIVCKAKGRMVIQLEYFKIQSPFSFWSFVLQDWKLLKCWFKANLLADIFFPSRSHSNSTLMHQFHWLADNTLNHFNSTRSESNKRNGKRQKRPRLFHL